MPRPKPRVDGVVLADNLYRDKRGRVGWYRYRRTDGTDTQFAAESIQKANAIAEHFNTRRHEFVPQSERSADGAWGAHVASFIAWREQQDPKLVGKESWRNRGYKLIAFAEHWQATPPDRLTLALLDAWWDALGHHQQKCQHAELRRFFNYLNRRGYCRSLGHNPFTSNDEMARLEVKPEPPKQRSRLTQASFRSTYQAAGERGYYGLQMAMAISLITTMRQGDILKLTFDKNVSDGYLQVVIGKSEAQRGRAGASRLQWRLAEHAQLRDLIHEARERSLLLGRCPYLVAFKPSTLRKSKLRTHPYQMIKDQLQDQFQECRPQVPHPPTFHEVRSLSSALLRDAGCSISDIQELMAHTDQKVTLGYMDGHQLPYKDVSAPELSIVGDLIR